MPGKNKEMHKGDNPTLDGGKSACWREVSASLQGNEQFFQACSLVKLNLSTRCKACLISCQAG